MAVPTDQEILDSLKTAYKAISDGTAASYSVNGRSYTALDLEKLRNEIAEYQAKVNRANRRMFAGITFKKAR